MRRPLFLVPAAVAALASLAPAQFLLDVDTDLGMDDGEITPDGRYGVVKMNAYAGSMRVYDMQTGSLVEYHECAFFSSGENRNPELPFWDGQVTGAPRGTIADRLVKERADGRERDHGRARSAEQCECRETEGANGLNHCCHVQALPRIP